MSVVTRIRAWPRDVATGLPVAVYLAGGSNDRPHYDGVNHYMAGVIAHPRFEASLSFDDDGWSARAVPAVSAVGWKPGDAARLDPLASLYWRDAAIEIERIAGGIITRRLTGTVAEVTIKEGMLVITCADMTNRLDKPVVTATFAGTGGIEGDVVATGRAKRRSYGRVWNVEGRLLSQAHNIWEFGDPARPLLGCADLRDKGRSGSLAILAWQGSAAATLAALEVAVPARGGGVFAPSIACAKWWTQPSGPLTADLVGEADGYSANVVGIAAQIVASMDGPPIVNQAAAMLLRPGEAGLHIGDTSETAAAALNRLLQPVTLIWTLTAAAEIEVRPWTFSGPAETLQATFISRDRALRPIVTRKVGYRKNERIHGDGDIAAVLTASDVVFPDGTLLSDVQPAEAGATNGTPDDAPFGGTTARDALDSILALITSVAAQQMQAGIWRNETDEIVVKDGVTIRQTVDALGANVGGHEAFILDIKSVDSEGRARALLAVNGDGALVAIDSLASNGIGARKFVADEIMMIDRNGDNPLLPFYYGLDNRLYLDNVYIRLLEVGAVKSLSIDFNQVTESLVWSASLNGERGANLGAASEDVWAHFGPTGAKASITYADLPTGAEVNLRLFINGAQQASNDDAIWWRLKQIAPGGTVTYNPAILKSSLVGLPQVISWEWRQLIGVSGAYEFQLEYYRDRGEGIFYECQLVADAGKR